MRIKGFAIIIFCITALVALWGCSGSDPAVNSAETPGSATDGLSIRECAIEYVTQQFTGMKEGPPVIYETLGFTEAEIGSSQLGEPFKIYLFDDTGQFFENTTEVFVFPVVFSSDIIGIIEVAYLPDSGYESGFNFGFGRSYGDELNSLRNEYKDDDLIIGNLNARLLFAISGEEVTVFMINFGGDLTEVQTNNILSTVHSAVDDPNHFRFPE